MGKWVADEVLDGALQAVATADRMIALADQPTGYAAAVAGRLAEVALSPGDFSMSSGAASGRRVRVAEKAGVEVLANGIATHVALVDSLDGRLLYVTTCPAQALSAGGQLSFDSWTVEIGAPA